jgi:hypothetical protein
MWRQKEETLMNTVSSKRLYVVGSPGTEEVIDEAELQSRARDESNPDRHAIGARLLVGVGGTLTDRDMERYKLSASDLRGGGVDRDGFGVATGEKQSGQRATSDDDVVGRVMENKVAEARGNLHLLPTLTKYIPSADEAERNRLRRELGMPEDQNATLDQMREVGGIEQAHEDHMARAAQSSGVFIGRMDTPSPSAPQSHIDVESIKAAAESDPVPTARESQAESGAEAESEGQAEAESTADGEAEATGRGRGAKGK